MRTKMLLAWPTLSGNNYQHWDYFACDFERGIVWDFGTKFNDDPFGLYFRYDEYRNEAQRLMEMVFPQDKITSDSHFITNGVTRAPGFWKAGKMIDCRFRPVFYHYLTGKRIGMRDFIWAKRDEYYAEMHRLDRLLSQHSKKDYFYSGDAIHYIEDEVARLMLCVEFNNAFNRMEPSQVKFSLDGPANGKRNVGSLSGMMKSHLRQIRFGRCSELADKLAEALNLNTDHGLTQIRKAIERRARKHPSASSGTVNILRLLNASRSISTFTAKLKSA